MATWPALRWTRAPGNLGSHLERDAIMLIGTPNLRRWRSAFGVSDERDGALCTISGDRVFGNALAEQSGKLTANDRCLPNADEPSAKHC